MHSAAETADALNGARWIGVEFMYKPRPDEGRARFLFDAALRSRLHALARTPDAAGVWLCRDAEVIDSLRPLLDAARIPIATALVNPVPLASAPDPDTPFACGWESPDDWQPIASTDRWARIGFALEVGVIAGAEDQHGGLLFAAHDAVWGDGLIDRLIAFSAAQASGGTPAAVSPYSPFQHSAMPDVEIPLWAIDAINAAFMRDPSVRERMARGAYQGFWGKTGLLPFALCERVRTGADRRVWEDDLEIDRAIRAAGYTSRALWIDDPALYRQSLPVFDEAGVRAVIDRTLHYSLNLPGKALGAHSLLTQPLPDALERRRAADPDYRAALALGERLTRECLEAAADRIARTWASWIDWGAFRHVVRVGDPFVTVWNKRAAA